ncbi:Spindle pole body component [Pleurotus pulmonarius]
MIAEIFLVLAGHSSSLFTDDGQVDSAIQPLLHPGEQQVLEFLGKIALQYRTVKKSCTTLSSCSSRYVCALCTSLNQILKDEYESLVLEKENKVLRRDAELVGRGSFVPLSTIRAIFSEWESPLATLVSLVQELEGQKSWPPGLLIDMLLMRSKTGVHRVADILSRLSMVVQRVWRTQLTAFLVHGSMSATDPLTNEKFILSEGSMPRCVSSQSRESIAYVGRAVGTVKAAKWQKQLPRHLALQHTELLDSALPEDQIIFDRVISEIRLNVSDWLWMNILTEKDVSDAVDSLANYFLLRNGEFSLSLIREIERLKISRLASRSGVSSMIREQDLNLAILRASLGTSAQHDPALAYLRFSLPSGPLRPLLPSLAYPTNQPTSPRVEDAETTSFKDLLLGTPITLNFSVSWPLDLFLHSADLLTYTDLHAFLSSLRKTHTRIHNCWTSLSNAQRARRRWTGLGEGGTDEDLKARSTLLRCGWGVVRDMGWFLDTLLAYVMTDVVDTEYRQLKSLLGKEGMSQFASAGSNTLLGSRPSALGTHSDSTHIDFTTLRTIHSMYLDRLVTGCLLTNDTLTSILRSIFEVCERLVAQIERWGGDVLPALLFEGSIHGDQGVGIMVQERWEIVAEINKSFHACLGSFYHHLSESTSHKPFTTTDASKSVLMNASGINNVSLSLAAAIGSGKLFDGSAEVRRHVERLLLRLDFSGNFSLSNIPPGGNAVNILQDGGLV